MLYYDFPLSPKARTYLKFEKIFSGVADNRGISNVQETYALLRCIVDYIDLVDGTGSIKIDILKDLERCDASLREWQNLEEADGELIKELRSEINASRTALDNFTRQRVVLQSDPILETVKPRFRTPSGINCFDTPLFEFWLHLPIEERRATVDNWLHELDCLRIPISTVLYLWRLCATSQERIAHLGFMQENADSCDLINVSYDESKIRGYPVVSGFQSRINVRFLPYDKGAPVGDIPFAIAYIRGDLK